MRIAVVCGGTGGHMFPGLAVARELAKCGAETKLVLSGRDIENAGIPFRTDDIVNIPCGGTPDWRNPVRAAGSVMSIVRACLLARRAFKKFRPDAVLSMGAYTSVGPGLAAWSLRIPLVIHDSNAVPGLANRFLCRFAVRICVAFDCAARYFPKHVRNRVAVTGMPVREEIGNIPRPPANPKYFNILVMGGSQGSLAVNNTAAAAFGSKEFSSENGFRIVHIAGGAHAERVRKIYPSGCDCEVLGFSDNMPELYSKADLVVSRAGAASCFELCKCGLPSILIPLPKVGRNHQTANAECMVRQGAAVLLPQSGLTPDVLAKTVLSLRADRARLASMRDAGRKYFVDGAAARLAETVCAAAESRNKKKMPVSSGGAA